MCTQSQSRKRPKPAIMSLICSEKSRPRATLMEDSPSVYALTSWERATGRAGLIVFQPFMFCLSLSLSFSPFLLRMREYTRKVRERAKGFDSSGKSYPGKICWERPERELTPLTILQWEKWTSLLAVLAATSTAGGSSRLLYLISWPLNAAR